MGFFKEWDDIYKKKSNFSIWPWSDVVSLTHNYILTPSLKKKKIRVLELGCGAGANIPFFLNKSFDYHGVDGSKTIINLLKKRYPKLKKKLQAEDFTKKIPFGNNFDLILDRASLICNDEDSIKFTIKMLKKKLKKGGKFIAVDWYSTKHIDFKNGKRFKDNFTKKLSRKSVFSNNLIIQFLNENKIKNYFKGFKFKLLYEKVIKTKIKKKFITASWSLVVEK